MRRSFLVALFFLMASFAFAGRPDPVLPNPRLTPGDAFDVTVKDIVAPGYAKRVRRVPVSVKRAVFKAYGIPWERHSGYEVDHLISLELGGSNSIQNLWPESYSGQWNARVKDRLENRLKLLAVHGQLDLKTAQAEIAKDWVAAYRKYAKP
jgi:hypothetical protein